MIRTALFAAALSLAAAGHAATHAAATLAAADGSPRGSITLDQLRGGVAVVAKLSGFAPGVYAVHVHEAGKCDAPDFKTAGAHFNPDGHQHGKLNAAGPHLGDLPNVTVAADGTGAMDATVRGLVLTGGPMPLLDADGAAVVVHAAADDYKTDPSGNSGARIACGVLR